MTGLTGIRALSRQEGVLAGAFSPAKAQEHARRNHRQVRQLRKSRHAGVRRPLIPIARSIHRLFRGAMPVVRLDESNGDSRLDPLGSTLSYKPPRAVPGRESAACHGVFDSDGLLAFGQRSGFDLPSGIAGMPAMESARRRLVLQPRRPSAGGSFTRVPSLGVRWAGLSREGPPLSGETLQQRSIP